MNLFSDININYSENSIYICNFESIISIDSNEVIIKGKKIIVIKGINIIASKILDNEVLLKGVFKRIDFNE